MLRDPGLVSGRDAVNSLLALIRNQQRVDQQVQTGEAITPLSTAPEQVVEQTLDV